MLTLASSFIRNKLFLSPPYASPAFLDKAAGHPVWTPVRAGFCPRVMDDPSQKIRREQVPCTIITPIYK